MDNNTFRKRSGKVNSEDRVVALLYLLMRDHLPVGKLESIVMDVEKSPNYEFTNGFIAENAKLLVERLRKI